MDRPVDQNDIVVLGKKRKLYIDFDNTITNSSRAYAQTYNHLYSRFEGFQKCDPTQVEWWSLYRSCPLCEDVDIIFSSDYFFKKLEFIEPCVPDCIARLQQKYDVYIATIGITGNIKSKEDWLNKNLPDVKRIYINNFECIPDKSMLSFNDAILVDDSERILDSTGASQTSLIMYDKLNPQRTYKYLSFSEWERLTGFLLS
jgi:5'(3')-deoxyribonucleotidase